MGLNWERPLKPLNTIEFCDGPREVSSLDIKDIITERCQSLRLIYFIRQILVFIQVRMSTRILQLLRARPCTAFLKHPARIFSRSHIHDDDLARKKILSKISVEGLIIYTCIYIILRAKI